MVQPHAVQVIVGVGDNVLCDISLSCFIDPHCGHAAGNAQKDADGQQRRDYTPEHVDHGAGNGPLTGIRCLFAFYGLILIHNCPSIAANARRYEK